MVEAQAGITWRERMKARVEGADRNLPWHVHDKLRCYKFCHENGIATPIVYRIFHRDEDLDFSYLPDRFVLKPNLYSSTIGVMPLQRIGDGRYLDTLKRVERSADDIKTFYRELRANADRKYVLFAEETVAGEQDVAIPFDYKAYCFDGEIGFIMQINRNTKPGSVCWYDGSFTPLTDGTFYSDWKLVQPGTHAVPRCKDQLLDCAKRASAALGTPFVSVDMYASNRGALVGELTLVPGAIYYGKHYTMTDAFDRKLGEMWDGAIARLQAKASAAA